MAFDYHPMVKSEDRKNLGSNRMTEITDKKRAGDSVFIDLLETDVTIFKEDQEFKKEDNQTNISVKRSMAAELRKMGLSEMAIAKHLNIKP